MPTSAASTPSLCCADSASGFWWLGQGLPHQPELSLFETLMSKGNVSSSYWQARQTGKHIPMGWQAACLHVTWWQTGHWGKYPIIWQTLQQTTSILLNISDTITDASYCQQVYYPELDATQTYSSDWSWLSGLALLAPALGQIQCFMNPTPLHEPPGQMLWADQHQVW